MRPAPNVLPIKNTAKARAPIVDAKMQRKYTASWMKGHPKQTADLRAIVDQDVQFTMRGLNQIAAGRKVNF